MFDDDTSTSPTSVIYRNYPCGLASGEIAIRVFPPPTVAIPERVTASGMLMIIYLYVTQLRTYRAVELVRQRLDTDQLCVDHDLLDRLHCWPHLPHQVSEVEQARQMARVFGVAHSQVPVDKRDHLIQRQLTELLDAINSVSGLDGQRQKPGTADVVALRTAAHTVRARLSRSMTQLGTMQVRAMAAQLDLANAILTDVAKELPFSCRPEGSIPNATDVLLAMLGDELRADSIDAYDIAVQAEAWRVLFGWLADYSDGRPEDEALYQAAATLRPCRSGQGRVTGPAGAIQLS